VSEWVELAPHSTQYRSFRRRSSIISPCSQWLARCHVTRQRCSIAPAPKLWNRKSSFPLIAWGSGDLSSRLAKSWQADMFIIIIIIIVIINQRRCFVLLVPRWPLTLVRKVCSLYTLLSVASSMTASKGKIKKKRRETWIERCMATVVLLYDWDPYFLFPPSCRHCWHKCIFDMCIYCLDKGDTAAFTSVPWGGGLGVKPPLMNLLNF